MRHIIRFGKKSIVPLTAAMLFLLTACSGDQDTQTQTQAANSARNGSISFYLTLQRSDGAMGPRASVPSVCSTYALDTIKARLSNGNGANIASGNWPCAIGQGKLSSIPPQSNLTLRVEALSSGKVVLAGIQKDIEVFPGQVTQIGSISMVYQGGLIWDRTDWDQATWQ